MINVNEITKNSYKADSANKNWTISFPYLSPPLIFNDSVIIGESVELFESVLEGSDLQFVGCNSSRFSATVRIDSNTANLILKSAFMIVTLELPDIEGSESITVFTGYVDSVEMQDNKRDKKITAYDVLYSLKERDIATWYKTLSYPISLKSFRDSLFNYIGVEQEVTSLPIDLLQISRRFNPDKLSALDVIKQLCQVNCVFGRINRNGVFEYLTPSRGSSESVEYCKSTKYQEYWVKSITKVTFKYGDISGTYTPEIVRQENEYVVQNNMFMAGMDKTTMESAAQSVFPNIEDFVYMPFEADVNGLPYLECLDTIDIPVLDADTETWHDLTFSILNRTMSGTQALRDKIKAQGDETIHQFVSDLQLNIDNLEKVVEQIQNDLDGLKFRYYLVTNDADIDIADTDKTEIINLRFSATSKATTIFQAEILCEVETTSSGITFNDAKIKAIYEVNEVEITDYYPVQTWQDGDHILHLYKTFLISRDNLMTHLQVYLQLNGGSVHIDTGHLRASLYGQNLVAADEWGGIIEVDETATLFNLDSLTMDAVTDAVSGEPTAPETISCSETASLFNINEASIQNVADNCVINFSGNLTRITEDGDTRITEDNNTRETEGV